MSVLFEASVSCESGLPGFPSKAGLMWSLEVGFGILIQNMFTLLKSKSFIGTMKNLFISLELGVVPQEILFFLQSCK